MGLFNDTAEEQSLSAYISRKDFKGTVDYMRRTPFDSLDTEVLNAGYSSIGRHHGLDVYIDYVVRQAME